MQNFTIAECMCMLTGLTIPEPGEDGRTINEMCDMVSKFGGTVTSSDTAVDNAMQHCPLAMVEMCKLVDKDSCERVRDRLITTFGDEIELPIEHSRTGGNFLTL